MQPRTRRGASSGTGRNRRSEVRRIPGSRRYAGVAAERRRVARDVGDRPRGVSPTTASTTRAGARARRVEHDNIGMRRCQRRSRASGRRRACTSRTCGWSCRLRRASRTAPAERLHRDHRAARPDPLAEQTREQADPAVQIDRRLPRSRRRLRRGRIRRARRPHQGAPARTRARSRASPRPAARSMTVPVAVCLPAGRGSTGTRSWLGRGEHLDRLAGRPRAARWRRRNATSGWAIRHSSMGTTSCERCRLEAEAPSGSTAYCTRVRQPSPSTSARHRPRPRRGRSTPPRRCSCSPTTSAFSATCAAEASRAASRSRRSRPDPRTGRAARRGPSDAVSTRTASARRKREPSSPLGDLGDDPLARAARAGRTAPGPRAGRRSGRRARRGPTSTSNRPPTRASPAHALTARRGGSRPARERSCTVLREPSDDAAATARRPPSRPA